MSAGQSPDNGPAGARTGFDRALWVCLSWNLTGRAPGFERGLMGKVHLTLLRVNHGQSRTEPVRDLSGVALARTGPGVPRDQSRTHGISPGTLSGRSESRSRFILGWSKVKIEVKGQGQGRGQRSKRCQDSFVHSGNHTIPRRHGPD